VALNNYAPVLNALGICSFIIAIMMYLQMVSQAFDKNNSFKGILIGFMCAFYPFGTYYYCKDDWEVNGKAFKKMSIFFIIGVIALGLARFVY
jgi:uncharacterized membrane protein